MRKTAGEEMELSKDKVTMIESSFKDALRRASSGTPGDGISAEQENGPVEPSLRTWNATVDAMDCLRENLHDSLMKVIVRDIALEKQALQDDGFVFD